MIRTGTLHIVAGNLHVGKTEARNGNGGILAIRVGNVLEGTADNLYRCRLIDRINAVVPQFEMDVRYPGTVFLNEQFRNATDSISLSVS